MSSKKEDSFFIKDAKSLAPEILGAIFGLLAIGFVFYLIYLLTQPPILHVSNYIQLLVLIVISLTLASSIWVQRKKENFDESNIYLINSIKLINKAFDVLTKKDGTISNSRVCWVTAARLLVRSQEIALKISLPSHKTIYESEHDYQRHRFNDLLKIDGKPLPAEFFCGEGYVLGSIGASAYNTMSGSGFNKWIPSEIVAGIYRFSSYPKNYQDPLNDSFEFTNQEITRLWLFDNKGVCDYNTFRHFYVCTVDKIYRVNDETTSTEVDALTIDAQMKSLSGFEI